MNGVNLIPRVRVQARRRAARIRVWMVIMPLCASLLAGAYGWIRATWSSDVDAMSGEIKKADASILAADKEDSAAKARIAELQPRFRAAKAVGDQPDWGVLLSLIASRLGHDAVLNTCTLSAPTDSGAAIASSALAKPAKSGDAKARDSGRPERFTLALTGLARTQEAVSAFVSGLEDAGIFDRVAIAEARRTAVAGKEGVAFRVECTLSDSVTEAAMIGIRTIAARCPAVALWQIDALGLGICAALGALWYFAGVYPVSEAAASREVLQTELTERDAKLDGLMAARSTHQRLAAKLNDQIDAASVKLRPVEHVNARIAELNTLAVRHGLRIDEVRPGAPVTHPRYITVPIRLAGAGSYAECSTFLHTLRSDLRDMGVAGFELRGEPEAPDKPPTFAFTLLWYAAPAAPPARPAQK